ncbi:hypothetical protein GUITHDRAFT_104034 [Guillardia theta CCMP2712]|uniref:Uncharacterized protein n=1 Tax=Guillardia theta (strain CCMP2712) TaxID=905079 RepID=L1JPV2_GUITC|nr:hypothetical protein GUITHDRAFT_104034 [Guillardia theta CCMP2712]EKX50220.1 hypothetical protein GUITHDRAFT_104034 [Guillardia theta CCMP2712]|eukprot:XP_005837200.1 hypothetical protein GUITHDRAFT_104034 [Guillardia theta CCMP2712]
MLLELVRDVCACSESMAEELADARGYAERLELRMEELERKLRERDCEIASMKEEEEGATCLLMGQVSTCHRSLAEVEGMLRDAREEASRARGALEQRSAEVVQLRKRIKEEAEQVAAMREQLERAEQTSMLQSAVAEWRRHLSLQRARRSEREKEGMQERVLLAGDLLREAAAVAQHMKSIMEADMAALAAELNASGRMFEHVNSTQQRSCTCP